jgi:hypothetical protein
MTVLHEKENYNLNKTLALFRHKGIYHIKRKRVGA